MAFKAPEEFRETTGPLASDASYRNNGAFKFRPKEPSPHGYRLVCIASDQLGWEHVSCCAYLDKERMIPTWEHMCLVKSMFWDDEDVVMQLHPAKSNYVNCNPYVLHLWRPIGIEIPTPPKEMV